MNIIIITWPGSYEADISAFGPRRVNVEEIWHNIYKYTIKSKQARIFKNLKNWVGIDHCYKK